MKTGKARNNSGDDWATPKSLYDKLDSIYHFDFDPCPYQAHSDMNTWIVAYNAKTLHHFEKNELFKAGNVYEMNDKAEVDLWLCEKLIPF